MTTDPGPDPKKPDNVCPKCGEPYGSEHKKNCGLWSPYSTSKWVAPDKKEPAAIVVQVPKCWPFPQSMIDNTAHK